MKIRHLLLLLLCMAVTRTFSSFGEETPKVQHEVTGERTPWTSLDVRFAPRDFQFAIVTDNTGTPRPGIFREAMEKLNLLQPSFVMSVGDLVDGYVETAAELHGQWDALMSEVDILTVPFFFVPGNHDVGRPLWYDVYRERVGPSYYYFLYQNVLFLCLDSNSGENRGTGYSEEQIVWAKQVLEKHPDVRWTYIFQHKPLWFESSDEWERIRPSLEGRPCTIFAGHIHNYVYSESGGIKYMTLGTTGGGTPLRGPMVGEFDHVVWVTVTDQGPIMAALSLDGIQPPDFRTATMAKELQVFARDAAVRATPVLVSGDSFRSGTSTLEISNPWDRPLRFQGLIETADNLKSSKSALDLVVPPKEKHIETLAFESVEAMSVTKIQPVVLHWEAAYDFDNRPSLSMEGKRRIVFESTHSIPRVEGIVVDGALEDWPDLPYRVDQPADIYTNETAWLGPRDCRYEFGVAEDDRYLHLAIRTFDDQLSASDVKVYQDFGAVYLNLLPNGDPDKETQKKAFFSVLAGADLGEGDRKMYEENDKPEGVLSEAKSTESGHTYEMAIPLEAIEKIQGGKRGDIQLNVGVNDYDPSQARLGVSVLFWRPQWESASHFPSSGIFQRADSGSESK